MTPEGNLIKTLSVYVHQNVNTSMVSHEKVLSAASELINSRQELEIWPRKPLHSYYVFNYLSFFYYSLPLFIVTKFEGIGRVSCGSRN